MSLNCKYDIAYNPLSAGSIDGTDNIPHDKAIFRAMNSTYLPPKIKYSNFTVFVGRLALSVNEEALQRKFSVVGEIKSCRIVRDIVTGKSKGYGFVEYATREGALNAYYELNHIIFDGKPVIVDWEVSSKLSGWIPRRLGGGWGGKKESGQLRFGCRERKWKKPIVLLDRPRHNGRQNVGKVISREKGDI